MRGRGEQLVPVDLRGAVTVLIVVPPFRIATPSVYGAWDDLGGPTSPRTLAAPPEVAHLVAELGNDLEPAAEKVEPRLEAVRADVERVAGRQFLLRGQWFVASGPGSPDAAGRGIRPRRGRGGPRLVAHVGVTVPHGVEPA